jgi:hypothetical protein
MSVSFSPSGEHVVSGSQDKTVRLWSVESGELVRTLEGHTGLVTSVSFSPSGEHVLSEERYNKKRVWDVTTGQCLHATESKQPLPEQYQTIFFSSNPMSTTEVNLSSLTLENATVGLDVGQKAAQVHSRGTVAFARDTIDEKKVHLFMLHFGNEERRNAFDTTKKEAQEKDD